MTQVSIVCPNCQTSISVDEALSHQNKESLKKEFESQRELERTAERQKMLDWQEKIKSEQEERQASLKKELEGSLKKKILEESEVEQRLLKEELEEKKKLLQDARVQELELRKKQEALEEREKNLELETRRTLNEERAKIEESTQKRIQEEYQLTVLEKDKKMSDMQKLIDELKQKGLQGSQQLQGEVLELELEQLLKTEFPIDEVLPVSKGINGADVIQKIHDPSGRVCGVLVWEGKRTKSWDEKWIPKLKEDTRAAKADVAILVSTVLPKGISGFGPKDGIYISDFKNALAVAKILRIKIIELYHAKLSSDNKNDKKEILWSYLTGGEFKGRVESIVESFNLLKQALEKEKVYFTKKWAQQEKLIDMVVNQTIGMHGDLQGLMGASLPQIKALEMANFELVEVTEMETTTTTTNFVQGSLDDVIS